MIDGTQLVLFVGASLVLIITPGPDILQVLARSVAQGRRAGVVAALGLSLGVLAHTAVAALGLGAVLRSSPIAFHALRAAGMAYLIWIGVKAVLGSAGPLAQDTPTQASLRTVFVQSVLANVLNPKVALFFVAFLPQFVTPGRGSLAGQFVVLGVVFQALTAAVFSLAALSADKLGAWLRARPQASVRLQWLLGSVFIGLGLRLGLGG